MSSPIYQAIRQLSEEKDIPEESVIETIEAALAAAFRKDFGEKDQNVKVNFDKETGDFDVFDVKTVVEDMELPEEPEEGAEAEPPRARPIPLPAVGPDGQPLEDEGPKFNPKTDIMVTAARETLKPDAEVGEEIRTQLEVPAAFGRMAAQTAKQVIIQKIREAERIKLFGEFKDREHELVNATVQRREGRLVLIDLGRVTGIMPPDEQVPSERYAPGDRVKVYIVRVEMATRGPEIIVSRSHPDIIRRLFTLEIPEVAAGTVEIHGVAREAGARAKVSVSSHQENIDPIGSCIGQRGTRIQTVISELGGEKVDVILYDEDPAAYITNALSPAKVSKIELDEGSRTADVLVDEDQLSLAIGRGGQNVRLASRLTNWKINISKIGGSAPALEVSADGEVVSGEMQDEVKDETAESGIAEAVESAEATGSSEPVEADAAPVGDGEAEAAGGDVAESEAADGPEEKPVAE
ncbi:MAG: transcription termination factor NusA [bacterium]